MMTIRSNSFDEKSNRLTLDLVQALKNSIRVMRRLSTQEYAEDIRQAEQALSSYRNVYILD